MSFEWGALIPLFEGLGGDLLKSLSEKLGQHATERWQQIKWQQAAEEYCKKMLFLYDSVRVLGKSEPMSLEGLFTDVYILDKPTAYHRFDISQLQADPKLLEHKIRKHGLEVVKQVGNNRLFILGKPGAGKTTFLKYLTLRAIKGEIKKIPIFVSLKEWADSPLELMPFLVQQFEICNFPDAQAFIEHTLKRGEALVLFDGLDEVQQDGEQRSRFINVLRNFSKQYLSTQCVITCRIAATDYSFEQFTYVEVADFTEMQMQAFVSKWFHDTPKTAEDFLTEFAKEAHRGLRELGRIPLLLSLLCLNYEETQTFPARRVELYEEAIEALLKKWDSSRQIKRDQGYHKLQLGRKRQLFAKVAYDTFSQDEYFIPQNQLVKHIVAFFKTLPPADEDDRDNGEQVLKTIEAQHGIFTERAHQIYSFAHLTFQEYFTAKYITEDKQRVADLVMQHFDDKRWREVFFLVVSGLDNADFFFVSFKQAIDNVIKQDEKLVKLLQWTCDKTNSVTTSYKIGAVRSFYLFLARNLALALDIYLTYDLPRSLALALDFARALAFALDLSFTIDLALSLDSTLDLAVDYLLHISLRMSLIFQYRGDRKKIRAQIPKFKQFFSEVVKRCDSANSLSQALRSLAVPDSQSKREWQIFSEKLRIILQRERNIGYEWDLTEQQVETLETYLRANLLMVECLKLAAVTDRKAIEDSVLLPPG